MDGPWVIIEEERLHDGHMPLVRRSYRTPSGATTDFEVLAQGAVVVILALTSDGEAVLVRQYRPGPGRYCTELPAGFVDGEEAPAGAAARELSEETGYTGTLTEIAQLVVNGYSNEVRHVFVCTDAVRSGEPHPDEGEDLEVVTAGPAELRQLLRSGEMTVTDAAYVGLDHLGLLG